MASLVVTPIVTFVLYIIAKAIERYWPEAYENENYHLSYWATQAINFFDTHPFHLFLIPVTLMMIYTVYAGKVTFWGNNRQYNELECHDACEKGLLIESFGSHLFSERQDKDQQKKDWQHFLELVKEENPSTIRILGASGCDTFYSENSPLHLLIKNFTGSVRILMLDADCPSVAERARSLNSKVSDYRNDVRKSFRYLKKLRETKELLSVRLYSHLPNWKMVLTDKYLWLQYYTSDSHVEDTVVYIIYKNNDNHSLYTPFLYEFSRLWEAAQDGQ